jgi:hypothetical protein
MAEKAETDRNIKHIWDPWIGTLLVPFYRNGKLGKIIIQIRWLYFLNFFISHMMQLSSEWQFLM